MRRLILISAAVALLALQGGTVMAAKSASISVSPSTVNPTDVVTITYESCAVLRVTNPSGAVEDIDLPTTSGNTYAGGMFYQSFYSGPGTYLFGCVWNNGKLLASASLEVTP